ncbi:hypothetical protein BC937DRAFT_91105 [Endogone sp. FLAS-F59071]|nr:hypothetical protein BC937DRAFT_91105 [Endogone sp. FLAS-F59071]|eukprot:RUS23182.1 hypothetical protein BC937DRAFT_91105 [Endogone sp. FLAS-F59071]
MIKHRASQDKFDLTVRVLSCLESDIVYLPYKEHDRITADTQAVTHAAFLSMGTAWKSDGRFPWENPHFVGGIENVKVNVALRIYSNKWHVYAGLAIMNPSARVQIQQYAKSVADLFKLMITENETELIARVKTAGEFVFGKSNAHHQPILLSDSLLDEYSLSKMPKDQSMPNSHLSLLAMVDCWYQLGLNPYEHMVCQTPLFRLWMGITEYLFRTPNLLDGALHAAVHSRENRGTDMEFLTAARGWAECVDLGNMEGYRRRFEGTASFFKDRFAESAVLGNRMIQMIMKKTGGKEKEGEE